MIFQISSDQEMDLEKFLLFPRINCNSFQDTNFMFLVSVLTHFDIAIMQFARISTRRPDFLCTWKLGCQNFTYTELHIINELRSDCVWFECILFFFLVCKY